MSISIFKYRKACVDYIDAVLARPRMHFRTLDELESIIYGHGYAYEQLGLIERSDSFNWCFSEWLYHKTGQSKAAGWAYAIRALSKKNRDDPERLFSELVRGFLSQWNVGSELADEQKEAGT